MEKSERYLKEIAKNTAEIAKELKKMNGVRKENPKVNVRSLTDAQCEDLKEWCDKL